MAVLATIGMIDTGSITAKRWGWIGSLSCPGGSDGCDKVLSSAWGSIWGQPLSLYGSLTYGLVILLAVLPLLPIGKNNRTSEPLTVTLLVLITTGMACFSAVLMGIMALQIKAFCAFCVLSAALSFSLFVLALIMARGEERSSTVFRVVITALLVLLLGLGWSAMADQPSISGGPGSAPAVQAESSPARVQLAEHLSAIGAKLYTAYWCPHCRDQKELFGKQATAKISVIECAPDGQNSQSTLCAQKGVQGYPSWEINGTLDSGVKSLDQLADLSGYKGSRAF